MTRALLCGAAALLLAGCQTPPAVYELADKTSANAGIFQGYLGQMAEQSKAIAARRAEHVASMDAFNAELDTFIKRELYMREKASVSGDWAKADALMKELAGLRDELIAVEAGAQFAQQERRKAILDAHKDLETFQATMRDAANALNALAKHESDLERARFFGKYMADVAKSARASLDKSDQASRAAKDLVDKVTDDLRSARNDFHAPSP